jgi:hypothetical protein
MRLGSSTHSLSLSGSSSFVASMRVTKTCLLFALVSLVLLESVTARKQRKTVEVYTVEAEWKDRVEKLAGRSGQCISIETFDGLDVVFNGNDGGPVTVPDFSQLFDITLLGNGVVIYRDSHLQ